MSSQVGSERFRQTLGQYPTGVVVVSACDADGQPLGMTVGSFTSVSLDPPLVAFLPSKTSSSWASLKEAGSTFCINVLAAGQERICRAIATRKSGKFADIEWRPSPLGNPIISGCVAWIECALDKIYDGGDHDIVVGAVESLSVENPVGPLLFYRGGYGSFSPLSLAAGDADLIDQLKLIDVARPAMEQLSRDLGTEVTVTSLVRDEVVLTAAVGERRRGGATLVGLRVPFVPPIGSYFAAWGDDEVRERWLQSLEHAPPEQRSELVKLPDRVKERGFAITMGNGVAERLIQIADMWRRGVKFTPSELDTIVRTVADSNPEHWDDAAINDVESLSAPVWARGRLAFMMTLWGPFDQTGMRRVSVVSNALLRATSLASEALKGDSGDPVVF